MSDYYVTMFEQERGPYSADDLQQLAKDGTLSRAALIRCPNGESIRAERIHALWDFVGRKWFPLWLFISLCAPIDLCRTHTLSKFLLYFFTLVVLVLVRLCTRATPLYYRCISITLYFRILVFGAYIILSTRYLCYDYVQGALPAAELFEFLLALYLTACGMLQLVDLYYARQYWKYASSLKSLR